jgi:hypothetical protein
MDHPDEGSGQQAHHEAVVKSAYDLLKDAVALANPAAAPRGQLLRRIADYRRCIADVAGVLAALGDDTDVARVTEVGGAATVPAPQEAARPAGQLMTLSCSPAAPEDGPNAHPARAAADPAASADASDDHATAAAAGSAADPRLERPRSAGPRPDASDAAAAPAAAVGPSDWRVPPHCVPIHANVTTFDWQSLYSSCQFDVVLMDPPWQVGLGTVLGSGVPVDRFDQARAVPLQFASSCDNHISI